MKPVVNLEVHPFTNRRLFWLMIIVAAAAATFVWLRSLGMLAGLEDKIARRKPAVSLLEARVKELGADKQVPLTLEKHDRAAYWAASDLIERKAFSWTLLLNEIERHIPPRVRVVKVGVSKERSEGAVAAAATGRRLVTLNMEVVAKTVEDATGMIQAFNRTGRFVVTPKWQKPIEGITDVEFGLDIDYEPPPFPVSMPSPSPDRTPKPVTTQVAVKR